MHNELYIDSPSDRTDSTDKTKALDGITESLDMQREEADTSIETDSQLSDSMDFNEAYGTLDRDGELHGTTEQELVENSTRIVQNSLYDNTEVNTICYSMSVNEAYIDMEVSSHTPAHEHQEEEKPRIDSQSKQLGTSSTAYADSHPPYANVTTSVIESDSTELDTSIAQCHADSLTYANVTTSIATLTDGDSKELDTSRAHADSLPYVNVMTSSTPIDETYWPYAMEFYRF